MPVAYSEFVPSSTHKPFKFDMWQSLNHQPPRKNEDSALSLWYGWRILQLSCSMYYHAGLCDYYQVFAYRKELSGNQNCAILHVHVY